MYARVKLSKETQAKLKRGMSAQDKGKILYGRLCDAAEDGTLSKCKTRWDVARLVGYTADRKDRGYSWISNLLRRGHVSEVMVAPGEFQYFLGPKKPDYDYKHLRDARKTFSHYKMLEEKKTETQEIAKPEVSNNHDTKLTITIDGRITIALENATEDMMISTIKQAFEG